MNGSGKSILRKYRRWFPSVILAPICLYLILNRFEYLLIDNFNLIIHEGGHGIFYFFPRFIYIAGGTIMQILIPGLVVLYFYVNGYRTGIQFGLLWLGQNFINVSVYAADAQVRKLPLLGGRGSVHDWHYMLSSLGILQYDYVIGYIFYGVAILIFIYLLVLPLFMTDRERDQ